MLKQLTVIGLVGGLVASAPAGAHGVAPSRYLETAKPYAPYEFLIGDWYSKVPSEDLTLHQRFSWGPDKSYIIYSTYLSQAGKPEQLHFEGMMVWNGKSKALDFLFAVQPPTGAQEKGTVSVSPDGTVVRDVEMTEASGKGGRFRQTFRPGADGKVTMSAMRQTDKGWETSPPGDLIMARQQESAAR